MAKAKELDKKALKQKLAKLKTEFDSLSWEHNLAIDECTSYAEALATGLDSLTQRINEVEELIGKCDAEQTSSSSHST